MPPFHFQTKATSDDPETLRTEVVFTMAMKVKGVFSWPVGNSFDVTFGMNTKGGMDDCKFMLYVLNNLLWMYTDTLDLPGRCLIIKHNSDLGHLKIKLLAQLRYCGVYYSISYFMSLCFCVFRNAPLYLELLVDKSVKQEKSVSVPHYKHLLSVLMVKTLILDWS